MNLEKLIEQIDENYYKINNYYLSITHSEEFAKRVALEFGKRCFEASREASYIAAEMYIEELLENDKLQYQTFEDYLKSLENE
jgi:hypothetical protein